jgi:uncharacterized protein (UPF0332 family)
MFGVKEYHYETMKPETQALLNKARQNLLAAGNLWQDGFLDIAASRAYYAMFYTAEALLIDQGLSYSSHSAVIAAFGKTFAKTGVLDSKFHRYLLDAQDTRNIGDYSIGPGVTDDQVRDSIKWAEEFLKAAESQLSES